MTALRSPHTPGPWERFDREIHCRPVNGSLAKLIVAKVAGDDDESEANARLIAAAPELLEALQDMLALEEGEETDGFRKQDWLRKAKRRGQIIERARAAIAKATGAS